MPHAQGLTHEDQYVLRRNRSTPKCRHRSWEDTTLSHLVEIPFPANTAFQLQKLFLVLSTQQFLYGSSGDLSMRIPHSIHLLILPTAFLIRSLFQKLDTDILAV